MRDLTNGTEGSFWFDTYTDPTYFSFSRQPRRIRAGWKKTAAGLAVPATAAGIVAGLAADRPFTEQELALAGAAGACVLVARTGRRCQEWGHRRHKVKPLACALSPILDLSVQDLLRSWLHVPLDYDEREDALIVIDVPADFTAAERDMEDITRAVCVKLGIEAPTVTTKLASRHPRLVYAKSQPPPLEVTLADILPDIKAAKPSEVILGLGKPIGGKRSVIRNDVDSEQPQAAASMSTGEGKSMLAMNYAAQLAYHGAFIIILDYKWFSHMWADGLPNVCYARTPQEIHEVLCWLGYDDKDQDGNIIRESELTRRKRVGLAAERAGIDADLGARICVIAEEQNATGKVLRRHQRRIGKGPSPALEALDEVGSTGRQLEVTALYIAQRLSARASGADGSADARENIGLIVTKDPKKATWDMLAGGHVQPPASGHKGRYQVITGDEVREMQGVLYDKDKKKAAALARELATSGIVARPRHDMPFVTSTDLVPAGVRHEGSSDMGAPDLGLVSTVPAALPVGGQVKLADMVAAGLFVSILAARRRSTRDPLFPAPAGGTKAAGYLYNVAEIYAYLAAKGELKR